MSALVQRASISVPSARESILLDCRWKDVVWTLKPTNLLEQASPERIRWDFELPSGRRFTDPVFAPLLETARAFTALIRLRSLSTGLALRASTAAGYARYLRMLIGWMESRGFDRFAALDEQALRQFQRWLTDRRSVRGRRLAPTTIQKYLYMLVYLYRYRQRSAMASRSILAPDRVSEPLHECARARFRACLAHRTRLRYR